MDEIHVHKTKKSICAHFAESPCTTQSMVKYNERMFSLLSFSQKQKLYITKQKQFSKHER